MLRRTFLAAKRMLACVVLAAVVLVSVAPLTPATARATSGPVTLFAAASTMEAVRAVLARFREANPDVPVRASFAASSTLAKQIARGAPADLYLSANVDWMDYLQARGAIDADSRTDLLGNRLVLVVRRASGSEAGDEGEIDPRDLPNVLNNRRLAIGDPAHVPAGQYARAALEDLKLWTRLRGTRTAFASDVRAALALVARGETAAGIVYATDARISDAVRVAATFPADSHPPIRYPLAKVNGRANADVEALMDFLCGATAAKLFRAHGFEVHARPARSG